MGWESTPDVLNHDWRRVLKVEIGPQLFKTELPKSEHQHSEKNKTKQNSNLENITDKINIVVSDIADLSIKAKIRIWNKTKI